ncbi:MAG: response regulator transcription factor [Hyphomicrobiales bacterium]|nr:response regulator transcription factor [Hyphomicrobiales bacterium]
MRVLIVDDHPIVVSGCRAMLAGETDVEVFDAGDAERAYSSYFEIEPDIAVVDINLPGVTGLELARRILRRDPGARILVFSMNDDPLYATRAIDCGAKGYITKNDDPSAFVEAVRTVADGRTYLPPEIARRLAFQRHAPDASPLAAITGRELEIMQLLGKGRSLAEIAHDVRVSYKTVANTCALLKRKLGARTTADLVRMAVERRLA